MCITNHLLVGQRRAHVVDSKVESGDTPRRDERHDDSTTTCGVDQAGDAATVEHARLGIAHEVFAVREREGQVLGPVIDDAKIQGLVVRDRADVAPFQALPDFIFLGEKRVRHG
jgi:hypothetical protein